MVVSYTLLTSEQGYVVNKVQELGIIFRLLSKVSNSMQAVTWIKQHTYCGAFAKW